MNKISLFFILFFALHSHGQLSTWLSDWHGENSGHTIANFLSLPVSAGMLSLGDIATTGMMDATDIPNNPSNTALLNFQKLSVTHCEWLVDTRIEYAGACFPVIDVGTFGVYGRLFTPGSFANARDINQDVSNPSIYDMAAGVSYSRYFFDKALSLGTTVSYIESRLDDADGRTVTATFDASVKPSQFVNFHFVTANIGPDLTYNALPEPLPLSMTLSADIHPFSVHDNITDVFNPVIGIGVQKIADQALTAAASVQLSIVKKMFVRAGYEHAAGLPVSIAGLSSGAGMIFGNYSVDFGWLYKSLDLGSVFGFSVTMNMKEILPKTAEDYFKEAEKHYANHRLWLCVYNAKKALALNPSMWKAHALIALVNSLDRRENNLEIAILYTGNVRGQFVPVMQESGSSGGLARMATVLRHLSLQFPTHAIIDGGNFISQQSHPLKTKLAQTFYDELGYDAASVGECELKNGLPKLYPILGGMTTPSVLTNAISKFGLGNLVTQLLVKKNGYTFFVASVIAPSHADKNAVLPYADELTRALSSTDARNAHVRILIVHDAWDQLPLYAALCREGDVIIASSIRQEFATPMKIGHVQVLSAGENGKYVGELTLRFSAAKKLLACENHLFPLSDDIPSDSSIETKIHSIARQAEFDSLGLEETSLKRGSANGVFAFCSKRRGAAGLYLKVLDKNAEFPLTSGITDCSRPVVSFGANRIAYMQHADSQACPSLFIMDMSGSSKRRVPNMRCPTGYAFTPNGEWLYFSAQTKDSANGLFRMRPDGNAVYPVIDWKNSQQGDIAFSRDGASMAFCSNSNGKWQMFITDQQGHKPICITDGASDNVSPKFSPDNSQIAMLSNRTSFGATYDVWLYDIASGKLSQMTHAGLVKSYCWLNAQTFIVCSGANPGELKTVDIDTKAIAPFIASAAPKTYSETAPQILPVGKSFKVIYTREFDDGKKQVWWANPDGSEDHVVVNSETQDWLE